MQKVSETYNHIFKILDFPQLSQIFSRQLFPQQAYQNLDLCIERCVHGYVFIFMQNPMETIHLNQKQLAARWQISEATLERWRSDGLGPQFLKLPGRVIYRMIEIESFEESCLVSSTKIVKGYSNSTQKSIDSNHQ